MRKRTPAVFDDEDDEEEIDVYSANGLDSGFDDDEISCCEEAFMRGYLGTRSGGG